MSSQRTIGAVGGPLERKERGQGGCWGEELGACSESIVQEPFQVVADGMDPRGSIAAGMSCAQEGAGTPKAQAVGVVRAEERHVRASALKVPGLPSRRWLLWGLRGASRSRPFRCH